jgi:predicted molibdopterin-dependent oxidoreductase YjgC
MFKRLFPIDGEMVTLKVEDKPVTVPAGDSVAAAVYAAGFNHFRESPVSNTPRAPYCMMGVCFECLVEIDGSPNHQACMTTVRDGMCIKIQKGLRGVEP